MKELKIFFTAIMFYTRIPVPKSIGYSDENLNKATRYFPLVGIVIGSIAGFIFFGAQFILPKELAVLLSMIASIYITGAFHEDGFADFCDGFGGGYTKEKVLTIMKDSRIGTYGAVGLLLILALKFFSLSNIPAASVPVILICAHSFSRIFPVLIIYTTNYSRIDASSKTKPVGKKGSYISLATAVLSGLSFLYFIPLLAALLCIMLCLVTLIIFRKYILRKIDGYTGDVLGALQQICEIVFYIAYLSHFKFSEWI